jgi:hypothetical protein
MNRELRQSKQATYHASNQPHSQGQGKNAKGRHEESWVSPFVGALTALFVFFLLVVFSQEMPYCVFV